MVSEWRNRNLRVGFVPTMGALHEGHLSLIRQARQHADHVVVSVFVNPTQFGPGEDYQQYPRTLGVDVEKCRSEGVSLVFAPNKEEMYGKSGSQKYITIGIRKMNDHLCGAGRTGHFEGVLQVVNKLFHIIRPDVAVFGQKDIQQWFIIRQMVEEFDHPVEILMGPTKREKDGLALSSRNVYMSADERKRAPLLFETLQRLSHKISENIRDAGNVNKSIPVDESLFQSEAEHLSDNGFKVDYLSLVSTPDLQPANEVISGRLYVIAAAAWLGSTRLIDNVLLNTRIPSDHDA